MFTTKLRFSRAVIWALLALSLLIIADWVILSRELFENLLHGFFSRSSFFTASLTFLASIILLQEKGSQRQVFLAKTGLAYCFALALTPLQTFFTLGTASTPTLLSFAGLFTVALLAQTTPGIKRGQRLNLSALTSKIGFSLSALTFIAVQATFLYGAVVWLMGGFLHSDNALFAHLSPATATIIGLLSFLYLERFVLPTERIHPRGTIRRLIVVGSIGWIASVSLGLLGLGYLANAQSHSSSHLFGLQSVAIASLGSLFWLFFGSLAMRKESCQLYLDDERVDSLARSQDELRTSNEEIKKKNVLIEAQAKETEDLYAQAEGRIDELEAMNENIRQLATENEHLADAQRRFASVLAHEIRTPLNTLTGLINEMYEKGQTGACKAVACNTEIEGIKSTSEFLVDLVNSVLDYNKLKESKVVITQESFDVGGLFDSLSAFYTPRAHSKDLDLTFDVTKQSPLQIIGDKTRYRQILGNIIDNAIKFTDKGFVAVNYNFVGKKGNKTYAVLRIMDSGIGIKDSALETIFKPFSQASSSISKKYGGSGVGLSLCRELIEIMGGRIEVKSKLGYGTTFTVFIPAKADELQHSGSSTSLENYFDGKCSVLMVEDHPINGKINKKLLEKLGLAVHWVTTGEKAVELAKTTPYDLILMDLDLGEGINGYEAAKEIRKVSKNAKTPLVALTASDAGTIADRLADANITNVLDKPFKAEDAARKLRQILSTSEKVT